MLYFSVKTITLYISGFFFSFLYVVNIALISFTIFVSINTQSTRFACDVRSIFPTLSPANRSDFISHFDAFVRLI